MKLGLVTYQMAKDWDVGTIIERCREGGFEGVELRATHAHGVEESLGKAERNEVKEKFAGSGIRLYGLGSAFDYHTPDPEKLRADIEATKRYIGLAADLGCEGVKVRPNALPEGVPEEKTLEQIGKSLREVAAAGQEQGIRVWLEVHGRETCRPDRIRKIMDHADHENACVTWNCNSGEADAEGSVKANFALLQHKIGCVHIQDIWNAERYPWQEIFSLLKGIGYQGWTSYEGPGSSDPAFVMKCYRRIWELYVEHA